MTRSTVALSTGARIAGSVIALGFLLGAVPGTVVGVAGGLALATLGRAVFMDPPDDARVAAALVVITGCLGVAAIRWDTLTLSGIRGAQAVLGPTVLVGPVQSSIAMWVAGACGLFAASLWLTRPVSGRSGHVARGLEAGLVAFALVTAFWGPGPGGWTSTGWLRLIEHTGLWAAAIVVVAGAAAGLSVVVGRLRPVAIWAALAAAAVGTVVAAAAVTQAV